MATKSKTTASKPATPAPPPPPAQTPSAPAKNPNAKRELELLTAEMAKREMSRRHYGAYLAYSHGRAWKDTKMAAYLGEQVQDFLEARTGHAYDILLINTPPQSGKSMTLTETLPSWYLGKHPDHRIIIASYDGEFAERFCRRNKEKVKAFGKNLFGVEIGKIDRATEFELTNGKGRVISRGLLSGITGNPANLIIIDDPVKNQQEADSPTYRDRVWAEWQSTLKSRLAAGSKVIVIMTPWHEDDFAARLLSNEPNVRHIRLPIEAEINDPLGRPIGAPLVPELGKDANWLKDFKKSYIADPMGGARAWSALYQCSPRIECGNIVHREWWRFYDPDEVKAFGTQLISVDAAFKDGDDNDYVAITVWGKLGQDYYLRYCLNQHLNFPGTVAAIRTIRNLYPQATTVLIEDKANGSAIIQTLQKEMFCIPVTPLGGKVARVNAISSAIESGHVFLPQGAPWVPAFIDQFSAFPAGAHDDMCFVAGTMIATPKGDVPIENIRVGDKVITPAGVDTVVSSGATGVKEVITRLGLTGTPNHPVYQRGGFFVPLCDAEADKIEHLSIGGLLKWKYLKSSCSMGSSTDLWAPEDIISVSRRATKDDGTRKGCTSRYGSFTAGRKFRAALRFITRMATLSITTIATWSAYRAANTVNSLRTLTVKKAQHTSPTFAPSQRSGTAARKAGSGTGSTQKSLSTTANRKSTSATSAGHPSWPSKTTRGFAATTAPLNMTTVSALTQNAASASSVGKSLRLRSTLAILTEPLSRAAVPVAESSTHRTGAQKVYNLTVEKSHVYYANGVLVHNCDSASQALNRLIFYSGVTAPPELTEEQEYERVETTSMADPDILYDVYGSQLSLFFD